MREKRSGYGRKSLGSPRHPSGHGGLPGVLSGWLYRIEELGGPRTSFSL